MMPGPPAGPISPYHIFVTAVHNSGGSAVSGAQFTLKNTTKSTQTIATSSESDSNIVLNVADCGEWDTGDDIELEVSFGTENKTESTTINTVTHPMGREFGLIVLEITSVDVAMVLSMSQGIGNAASRHIDASMTLAHSVGDADAGQANMLAAMELVEMLELISDPDGSSSAAMTLAQGLGLLPTVEGENDASMTLSHSLSIAESAQATAEAGMTLAQFVGVVDGSPTDAVLSLHIVQSVSFTATAVIVGVITPSGRTVYISAETRTSQHGGYNT